MALRDPIGVWFSELQDNWEECGFFYDVSMYQNDRHDEVYRRYGDLPDGRRFGAGFIPAFGDPWARESAIVIVGETGAAAVYSLMDQRMESLAGGDGSFSKREKPGLAHGRKKPGILASRSRRFRFVGR